MLMRLCLPTEQAYAVVDNRRGRSCCAPPTPLTCTAIGSSFILTRLASIFLAKQSRCHHCFLAKQAYDVVEEGQKLLNFYKVSWQLVHILLIVKDVN